METIYHQPDWEVSKVIIPSIATNDIFTNLSVWNAYVEKYGKIVTIHFNIAGTMVASSAIQDLFTLPEGYRPLRNCMQNYPAQDISGGKSMLLVINTDGRVQVYNNKQAINDTFFLRQVITYIAQ